MTYHQNQLATTFETLTNTPEESTTPSYDLIHQLLCQPDKALLSNSGFVPILGNTLRSIISHHLSTQLMPTQLTLVSHDDHLVTVERASINEDYKHTFSGYWLSKNSPVDGVTHYIDIRKQDPVGTMVFIEPLLSESVIMTELDSNTIRVYLDPRSGLPEPSYRNIINYYTALDYKDPSTDKEPSTDTSMGNVQLYQSPEGWILYNQRIELKKPDDAYTAPESLRRKRTLSGAIAFAYANAKNKRREPPVSTNQGSLNAWVDAYEKADEIFNSVKRKGQAALLTYGGNYHSSWVVYDSVQKGPVLLTYGGRYETGATPTLTASKKKLTLEILSYGLTGQKSQINFRGLSTDKMIAKWPEVALTNYHERTNNCAHSAQKLLLAGVEPYTQIQGRTLKQTFPSITGWLTTPRDVKHLALKVQLYTFSQTFNTIDTVVNLNDARFGDTSHRTRGRSSLRIRPPQEAFQATSDTTQLKSVDHFRPRTPSSSCLTQGNNQCPNPTFSENNWQTTHKQQRQQAKKQMKAQYSANMKSSAKTGAAVVIVDIIPQMVNFAKDCQWYHSLNPEDQAIYQDDLIFSGVVAFIPVFGGVIQKGYDTSCGTSNCFSQANAEAKNTELVEHLVNQLASAENLYLPSPLRMAVAEALTLPATFNIQTFFTDSTQWRLYSVPIEEKTGFSIQLETAVPAQQPSQPRSHLAFIVTTQKTGEIEKFYKAGINGELLKRNAQAIETLLDSTEPVRQQIYDNTVKWVHKVPTEDELEASGNYDTWLKPIIQGVKGRKTNPNYDPEKARRLIKETIDQAEIDGRNYLKDLQNTYHIPHLDTEAIAELTSLENSLMVLANPLFSENAFDEPDPILVASHWQSLTAMMLEALSSIEPFTTQQAMSPDYLSGYNAQQLMNILQLPMFPRLNFDHSTVASIRSDIDFELQQIRQQSVQSINIGPPITTNLISTSPSGHALIQQQLELSPHQFVTSARQQWSMTESEIQEIAINGQLSLTVPPGVSPRGRTFQPVTLVGFQRSGMGADPCSAAPFSGYKTEQNDIIPWTNPLVIRYKPLSKAVQIRINTDALDDEPDIVVRLVKQKGQVTGIPAPEATLRKTRSGYTVNVNHTGYYALRIGEQWIFPFTVQNYPTKEDIDCSYQNAKALCARHLLDDEEDPWVNHRRRHRCKGLRRSSCPLYSWEATEQALERIRNVQSHGVSYTTLPIVKYNYDTDRNRYEPIKIATLSQEDQWTTNEIIDVIERIDQLNDYCVNNGVFIPPETQRTILSLILALPLDDEYKPNSLFHHFLELANNYLPTGLEQTVVQLSINRNDTLSHPATTCRPRFKRSNGGESPTPNRAESTSRSFKPLLLGAVSSALWFYSPTIDSSNKYLSGKNQLSDLLMINYFLHHSADREAIDEYCRYIENTTISLDGSHSEHELFGVYPTELYKALNHSIEAPLEWRAKSIGNLPSHFRKNMCYQSIRYLLEKLAPEMTLAQFLKQLPWFAEFLLEDHQPEGQINRFLVGNTPWKTIAELLDHGLNCYEQYENRQKAFTELQKALQTLSTTQPCLTLAEICNPCTKDIPSYVLEADLNRFLKTRVMVPKAIMRIHKNGWPTAYGLVAPPGAKVIITHGNNNNGEETISIRYQSERGYAQ